MLTEYEDWITQKSYYAFKMGAQHWEAPKYGGNLKSAEIAALRPEHIQSIQAAYIRAATETAKGTQFTVYHFRKWVSAQYDILTLSVQELAQKRLWTEHHNALHKAIKRNDIHQVRELIDVFNGPSTPPLAAHRADIFFQALMCAVDQERAPIVQLLINIANPKSSRSWALQKASMKNSSQLMDVLYDVCDPAVALRALQKRYPDRCETWQLLEQRMENQRLHDVLSAVVETTHTRTMRRM